MKVHAEVINSVGRPGLSLTPPPNNEAFDAFEDLTFNCNFYSVDKVLSLLEACFDLISGFTFHENSNHGWENY
jgi:hypothetical protein